MSNLTPLPEQATEMLNWPWSQVEAYYAELSERSLSASTVDAYLSDWTRLRERVYEVEARLALAVDVNTADKEAEQRYNRFLAEVYPKSQEEEQRLRSKLLESGLKPAGFELALRKMRATAALFRVTNLPMKVEVGRLCHEYSKVTGGQTLRWEGEETTVTQLQPVMRETDRARRERAWRQAAERQLADRSALNGIWQNLLKLRLQMAANAGFPDYRSYRWQEMLRFDYTPDDCKQFQHAIEQAVVPAATRCHERRRKQLRLATLRPWDLDVDPLGRQALAPFQDLEQLKLGVHAVLERVDPRIGAHFRTMMTERLLDLDDRIHKAPGTYFATFQAAKREFIFMHAVGMGGDVIPLIHESGHAFHSSEANRLPYFQQRDPGVVFSETAAMTMEWLAVRHLARDAGGFYTRSEAARAHAMHLESSIHLWPYIAVVDAFQHWVYENPSAAMEPENCDRQWTELWRRFMPGVDWTGFEDAMATGWQRKFHVFLMPFFYIEYGMALIGAVQIWANAIRDRASAIAAFRRALALGGTKPLPELLAAAGARFAFDAGTLGAVVGLMEDALAKSSGQ